MNYGKQTTQLIQTKENEQKIEMPKLCGLPVLVDGDDKMVPLKCFLLLHYNKICSICVQLEL